MFAKTSKIIFGSFTALFGTLGVFFGIISMIDPVGSKMADDGDPFGVPPTFSESLVFTLIFVLIFIFGVNIISGFKWTGKKFSNTNLK